MSPAAATPIVVQKYGGSSLATIDEIRRVAGRIAETVDAGYRVVAVVSAMAGTTDSLLAQAKALSRNPNARELDMLLSVGERVSTALLGIALEELGHRAISFTGSQSGIITNTRHNRARIIEVRPYRLMDELDAGKVVIVAGYQGVSYAREITTLGRGGTDTTAVALAAALGAEHCEICSDVDGVYTADPRVVVDARRLPSLSHDEMVALARSGSRVLNKDCVELASRWGVALFAKATCAPRDDTGTVVRTNPTPEPRVVTALGHRARVLEISVVGESAPERLWELLAEAGAFAHTLEHDDCGQGLSAHLPLEDAHRVEHLERDLRATYGERVELRRDRGTVTVVGPGLGEEPAVLSAAMAVVREVAEGPVRSRLGSLELTFTLASARVEPAVRRLHEALFGG